MIKKVALPLIASLMFASSAQAAPGPTGPSGNVTYVPQVQLDLALAAAYWQVTEPTVPAPACVPVQVTVQPMVDAQLPDGSMFPASEIGAETVRGTCSIAVAPDEWALSTTGSAGRYSICAIIAHEYGLVLGLPEDYGNDMMNPNWVQGRQDALCARVYTPHHLSRYERRWIAGNTNA